MRSTPSYRATLLEVQRPLARTVYHAVPLHEAWTEDQIRVELERQGLSAAAGAVPDCLDTLILADLIDRDANGRLRRLPLTGTAALPRATESTEATAGAGTAAPVGDATDAADAHAAGAADVAALTAPDDGASADAIANVLPAPPSASAAPGPGQVEPPDLPAQLALLDQLADRWEQHFLEQAALYRTTIDVLAACHAGACANRADADRARMLVTLVEHFQGPPPGAAPASGTS